MATVKASYASSAALTITLASLADGSMRQSTAVDNSSNLYVDALVGGKIKTGASGVSASGYVDLYLAVSHDGGTTYSGDASGTDGAYSGESGNLIFLARVTADANATTYEFSGFSIAQACGGSMPQRWVIVVDNQTGAALDSTGSNHAVEYQGVHLTSA